MAAAVPPEGLRSCQGGVPTDTVTEGELLAGCSQHSSHAALCSAGWRVATYPPLVKTRGSAHSFGAYYFSIAKSGCQIGERAEDITPENEKVDRR
jgi:hypothetical protein